jgi:hypothetical protein
LPRDEINEGRAFAAIRNMHHVDAGDALEQLPIDMGRAATPAVAMLTFPGLRLMPAMRIPQAICQAIEVLRRARQYLYAFDLVE